jgi:argininosuccinate lyase
MLWGSRFKTKLNDSAMEFSSSLRVDINLIEEDLLVNKAHTEMLEQIGIISQDEMKSIIDGLNTIHKEFEEGTWKPEPEKYEDIHSAIEGRLFELIGDTAGKLHTGRSRNDQVATDLRLWVKKTIKDIISGLNNFQVTLLNLAEDNVETIIPGYTHLQRAQPISLAFHLMAYIEMLERDKMRFNFAFKQANVSPLGAGSIAGSTLPIDPEFTSWKLGFEKHFSNAMDAISDRDFVIDFINSCVIGQMHLSRLSEELILWSTSEWKFIKISDEYSTGSSLMPQKKNPDIAELVRGRSGKILGNYVNIVSVLKALPLSYNRDLQEDKEPVFSSFNIYSSNLKILNKIIESIEINKERFTEELKGDYLLSTDIVDWLVLQGINFRESHSIVGEIVKYLEDSGKDFNKLTLDEMKKINPIFNEDVLEYLRLEKSLARKQSKGSPNPEMLKNQIKKWKSKLVEIVENQTNFYK